METADTNTMDGVRRSIQAMQDAADHLITAEVESPFWPEKQHIRPVGRVVSLLRHIRFGDRTAEGPRLEDVPERYIKALTEGHEAAYIELVTKGHAPAKLSSGKGYIGEHRPETQAATYQIWKSYWDTAIKLRSINLNPHHQGEVVKSDVVFAPLGVVQKLNGRKEVRYEKDGIILACGFWRVELFLAYGF